MMKTILIDDIATAVLNCYSYPEILVAERTNPTEFRDMLKSTRDAVLAINQDFAQVSGPYPLAGIATLVMESVHEKLRQDRAMVAAEAAEAPAYAFN